MLRLQSSPTPVKVFSRVFEPSYDLVTRNSSAVSHFMEAGVVGNVNLKEPLP